MRQEHLQALCVASLPFGGDVLFEKAAAGYLLPGGVGLGIGALAGALREAMKKDDEEKDYLRSMLTHGLIGGGVGLGGAALYNLLAGGGAASPATDGGAGLPGEGAGVPSEGTGLPSEVTDASASGGLGAALAPWLRGAGYATTGAGVGVAGSALFPDVQEALTNKLKGLAGKVTAQNYPAAISKVTALVRSKVSDAAGMAYRILRAAPEQAWQYAAASGPLVMQGIKGLPEQARRTIEKALIAMDKAPGRAQQIWIDAVHKVRKMPEAAKALGIKAQGGAVGLKALAGKGIESGKQRIVRAISEKALRRRLGLGGGLAAAGIGASALADLLE